jgi:hypothetical protein
LPGVCQHHYRWSALQPVKRDPPGIPGSRQDKVADVQISREYGTGRHHQYSLLGRTRSGCMLDVTVSPTTDTAGPVLARAEGSALWVGRSAHKHEGNGSENKQAQDER